MVDLLWQDPASFGLQHLTHNLLNMGYSSTSLAVYLITILRYDNRCSFRKNFEVSLHVMQLWLHQMHHMIAILCSVPQ